jgi:hypothetical protein
MLLTDKYAPDGASLKVKARLVTKGYQDSAEGATLDSPTVRPEIIMMGLNIAASNNYNIDIFDVAGAFLESHMKRDWVTIRINAELARELLRRRPALVKGKLPDGTLIVRLVKALYGLKDAPRLWFETISGELREIGFQQSVSDQCLFFRLLPEGTHIILLHVDDMQSTGHSKSMNELRERLKKRFRKITENINPENINPDNFNCLCMTIKRDARRSVRRSLNPNTSARSSKDF